MLAVLRVPAEILRQKRLHLSTRMAGKLFDWWGPHHFRKFDQGAGAGVHAWSVFASLLIGEKNVSWDM